MANGLKKKGIPEFQAEPHQIPLDVDIRNKFNLMAQDDQLLLRLRKEWQGEYPKNDLTIHIGPLCSGEAVLADGETRERIIKQHRKLLGIEMEAYSIYAAAQEAVNPKPIPFAIKSVVDFADPKKNDSIQKYAAYISAQILKEFIESFL